MDLTVDPIDMKYRSTVGNRVAPSFTDFKQINLLYCFGRYFNLLLKFQSLPRIAYFLILLFI